MCSELIPIWFIWSSQSATSTVCCLTFRTVGYRLCILTIEYSGDRLTNWSGLNSAEMASSRKNAEMQKCVTKIYINPFTEKGVYVMYSKEYKIRIVKIRFLRWTITIRIVKRV